ncbi:hypothetical protein [Rhodoferax sp.]|uniref:hypothetical protein n=1 Tax=Rhodoferax sp. TaxID=50421 RepID=UPI00271F80B2|nr:hypothetical protein [Rhodoferax sp.]MDO9198592.1 hypothetical protein [Rhodoferax sp.]
MAKWKALIHNIEWQLEPSPLRENFHREEMAARKAIQDAAASGDELEFKAAMGSISGLRRRWARMLVVSLTACVFAQCDTSRQKIREWQKRLFGQSISSNDLNAYGKEDRSGGGRADFNVPDTDVDAKAKAIFDQYKQALKKL